MKLIYFTGVLLVLWGFSTGAQAEAACPPGMIPYGAGSDLSACGPDNRRRSVTPKRPMAPPALWADRYGSIASDADRGIYESVRDMAGVASAEQAALANCKSKGGRKCEILLTYHNGCAAIAFGDTVYLAQTGPTVEAANQKALSQCDAATTNCHVEFNVCSLPVRIQ